MAQRQDRLLLGVYVSSTSGTATAQGIPVARDAEAVERWLRTELAEVASPVGVEVHVRTRWGSPARELSALATELSADALVIGASARSWYRLGGTVPGWLASHASCPVFVIP
jgi:nucleotide-binding universal stress UspA family protein